MNLTQEEARKQYLDNIVNKNLIYWKTAFENQDLFKIKAVTFGQHNQNVIPLLTQSLKMSLKNKYNPELIKEKLYFVDGIAQKVDQIMSFLNFYTRWTAHNICGYIDPRFKENQFQKGLFTKKIAWIFSLGGPQAGLAKADFDLWKYIAMVASTNLSAFPNQSNVLPVIFNQAFYNFEPKAFVAAEYNGSLVRFEELLQNFSAAKKEALGKKLITNKLTNLEALEIMIGSDVKAPSVLMEIVASAVMIIDCLRKEYVVEPLVAKGYQVFLHGVSYGHNQHLQDLLLSSKIIHQVEKVFVANNYISSWKKAAQLKSGGVVNAQTKHKDVRGGWDISLLQPYILNKKALIAQNLLKLVPELKVEIEDTFDYANSYIKQKYGLINPLTKLLKAPAFAAAFRQKVIISVQDADEAVGQIAQAEKAFFKSQGIDLRINEPDNLFKTQGHQAFFNINTTVYDFGHLTKAEYLQARPRFKFIPKA